MREQDEQEKRGKREPFPFPKASNQKEYGGDPFQKSQCAYNPAEPPKRKNRDACPVQEKLDITMQQQSDQCDAQKGIFQRAGRPLRKAMIRQQNERECQYVDKQQMSIADQDGQQKQQR
ncbi:MAG: hypothetical protein WCR04_08770 [Fibrobacteraceae bacterium]